MDVSLLGTQATSALMTVFFINWLKKLESVPWVNYQSSRVSHLLSIVISGLATIGIHVSFANGTLTVTGLTLATIIPGLWHWAQQYIMTKGWYTMLQSRLGPPPQPPFAMTMASGAAGNPSIVPLPGSLVGGTKVP